MDSLYSRQVGTIGKNAMAKLLKLKILIIGCDTIGVECAKSLALMGVKKLYLYDNTIYNNNYYGRLIYKTGAKKKLSALCKEFLHILNPQLEVEILPKLDKKVIKQWKDSDNLDGIVQTTNNAIEKVENFSLELKIPYILGVNNALMGYIFVNFGNWTVNDPDGENLISGYIDNFSQKDGYLYLEINDIKKLPNSRRFNLSLNKDFIELDALDINIKNNKALNKSKLVIKVNYTLKLEQLLNDNPNILYSEKKNKVQYNHKKFSEQKLDNYQYIKLNSSFMRNDELYQNYRKFIMSDKITDYPFKEIENINTRFYILGTIIGNILASEVMKITGKYTPLNQDILFDYTGLDSSNKYFSNNKFYDTHRILDRDLLKIMKKQSIFMIGCGALGCEISKNLGMMGFSTFKRSCLTITDMDTIELSNLNRQFLYQYDDIGKHKSEILKKKLERYCPDIQVSALNREVGKTSEKIFNRPFWKDNDIIINALDNIEARKYVDEKCNLNDKPLFESGTLGTKANTQVIIPYKTATYSEIKDPVDNSVPMCTIRNFPNKIEHCVEWALDIFNKVFTESINDLQKLENISRYLIELDSLNNDKVMLERITNVLNLYELLSYIEHRKKENKKIEFSKFIDYAINIYRHYYYKPILNILNTYPESLTNKDGTPFWSGNKLKPRLNDIDVLGKNYFLAILSLLDNSLVNSFDVWWNNSDIALDLQNGYYNLKSKVKANKLIIDEQSDKTKEIIDENELFVAKDKLGQLENLSNKYNTIVYDKDIDIHTDMMEVLVNLRADMYKIELVDRIKVKLISGKIIPALSTTTSVIAGFVVLDILKYLSKNKHKFTEVNINLGINNYSVYNAMKPSVTHNNMFSPEYNMKIKTIPADFNTWSKIKICAKTDFVLSIKDLIYFLENTLNIKPEMIMADNLILYNSLSSKLPKTNMKKIFDKLNKSYKEYLNLDLCVYTEAGIPIMTPPIVYSYF